MSMQKIDNAVESIRFLFKRSGVKFTDYYLSKELRSHPFYPSLAALSDICTDYKVENEAIKLSYENLLTIQTPFVAHLNIDKGTFIVVEKITEDSILFHLREKHLQAISKKGFGKFG